MHGKEGKDAAFLSDYGRKVTTKRDIADGALCVAVIKPVLAPRLLAIRNQIHCRRKQQAQGTLSENETKGHLTWKGSTTLLRIPPLNRLPGNWEVDDNGEAVEMSTVPNKIKRSETQQKTKFESD